MIMRCFRVAASIVGCGLAMSFSAAALAQQGAAPPAVVTPPSHIAPHVFASVAEKLFQVGLGESRAAVISAESGVFANRMAAIYMGGVEGESWQQEVARIHDVTRVSALLLAAIEAQLDPVSVADPRLRSAFGATGVDATPDGIGLILAARIELARPGSMEGVTARMRADRARGAAVLAAIDHMIVMHDPVSRAMTRQMNRQVAFATAFSDAEGFEFPASPEDTAADLSLQIPELRQDAEMRIRLSWYAAYAPLGAPSVNRAAALMAGPEAQALNALIERAEQDVLEQLAGETGRAAARRMKGVPL